MLLFAFGMERNVATRCLAFVLEGGRGNSAPLHPFPGVLFSGQLVKRLLTIGL